MASGDEEDLSDNDAMDAEEEMYSSYDEDLEDLNAEPLTDDLKERIQASLSYRPTIRLSLEKVNTEWEKKMRFSILEPCAACGVANHVDVVDLPAREVVCEFCQNKETPTKTVVYKIKIPVGVHHGSTIVLPKKGHVFNESIQGNVVVTILDEPHEHYLRVYDDLVVFYQINHLESKEGVARLFTPPGCNNSGSIVIQTEPGCEVKDNDVFYVQRLGLLKMSHGDSQEDEWGEPVHERGNLYVIFFVRPKGSVNPVKLKNVYLRSCAESDDTADTVLINSSDQLNGSTSSYEMRQNGVRSPRKRKRNIEVEEKLNSVRPPEKVPLHSLQNQPPCSYDSKLSFLDRLVNHPGTIPLPFRDSIPEQLSLLELKSLWKRQNYNSWWHRLTFPRDRKLYPDSCVGDPSAEERASSSNFGSGQQSHCSGCLGSKLLFGLTDDTVDSGSEAMKELLTRNIRTNPNYLKFSLKCSLPRCRVLWLLRRVKRYFIDPKAQGRI